jgi:hypothetical protein
MVNFSRSNDPSPAQIAAMCLEIQSTWTAEERLKRLRCDWRPTFVRCDDVQVDMDLRVYDQHIEAGERLQAVSPA